MFHTIVWATDGSELADGALPLLTELADVHGARIVAVYVDRLAIYGFGEMAIAAEDTEARAKIEEQVDDLRTAGYEAELRVEEAVTLAAADLIAATASDVRADLIVLVTHARRGLVGALVGSVSRAVLHGSPCPVLVIPPPTSREHAHLCAAEGAGV